jgi:hypothetical protein
MPNAYARMMGAGDVGEPRSEFVGAPIEIVGDRAVVVAEVDNPAKYLEGKYTAQDRIDVGFGNAAILAAGAITTYTTTVSTPFKPEELTVPSWAGPNLSITAIDIGPCRYIDGQSGIPGDQYSEVSNTRKVSWGTVQTGVPMAITVRNDSAGPVVIKLCVRGLRLR